MNAVPAVFTATAMLQSGSPFALCGLSICAYPLPTREGAR